MSAITEHPTKITGMLIAVLGFIQANPILPQLLGEDAYAWVMFFVGIGVTALGFWNTHKAHRPQYPDANPNIPPSSHWLVGLFALLAMLVGCTTPPLQPTRTACAQGPMFEPTRCAKTIAEEYEVYQKQMLAIVQDPGASDELKTKLRRIDAQLTPPIIEMLKAAQVYRHIEVQLAAGETEAEKLEIANRELLQWINMAEPILLRFIAAVGG